MLIGAEQPADAGAPLRLRRLPDRSRRINLWIDNDAQHRGLHGAAGLADLEGKVVAALESWNNTLHHSLCAVPTPATAKAI